MTISEWQKEVYARNREKGFYDYEYDFSVVKDYLRQDGEEVMPAGVRQSLQNILKDYGRAVLERKLLMVVGEICEAHEELRNGHAVDDVYYPGANYGTTDEQARFLKPEGFPIELADAAIRLLDVSEASGIDMEEMMLLKHDYNGTRAYKHGRQF